jgi:hypothetical protein
MYQISGEIQRIGHVLDGMKGADGIVFFGMRGGMRGNRLVPDVNLAGVRITMRVEPDIDGVRQMPRQSPFATADVENFLARSNQFGDAPEFGPGDPRNAQGPVKISTPIEVQIKSLVALQHRIEEGEAAGRLPQAEVLDTG